MENILRQEERIVAVGNELQWKEMSVFCWEKQQDNDKENDKQLVSNEKTTNYI